MEKQRLIELLERSLGIKHKLRVSETIRPSDSHEDIARTTVALWDLEDELFAIEQILADARKANVETKRKAMLQKGGTLKKKKSSRDDD